jgi:protein dithiol:quinone oxidoreductase
VSFFSNLSSRNANLLGAFVCVALLAYAYFSQFVLHLDPCPLCIFQRVGVVAMGAVFLTAAAHDPRGDARKLYAVLVLLTAGVTITIAVRHLWIQSLPEGSVPSCGASLKFMLKVLPLSDVLSKVLNGSGECAKITWRFLGLSMPAWVLISAASLGGFGVWANMRKLKPVLRF